MGALGTGTGRQRAYIHRMAEKTRVLYNETCPICRFEVESYRRQTDAAGGDVAYDGLDHATEWGLSPDQAARRFHVMQDGQLLSGIPAFRALWQKMPHLRWLAWLTGLPVIAPMVTAVYDHILAPLLHRAHLRRQKRAKAAKP
jgi:predicted DCC family thiol-disulfide oxidoreductase YuxK